MYIPELELNQKPWAAECKDIISGLHSDKDDGLTNIEAKRRLAFAGFNRIDSGKRISPLAILLNQFLSPFVLLLAIAAGLSFLFEEWLDGFAIIAVIFINAAIGFFMEFQAERSMEALKKLTVVPSRVIRDGRMEELPSEELVPGDILFLESGDMITADARLITSVELQTDESALTGESLPVEKLNARIAESCPLAERKNMLYKGTFVTTGNGYAVITTTGMSTELGKIAKMLGDARQAATPLEKKIHVFSKKLIWVTIVLLLAIFAVGMLNGQPLVQMLETAIALAVAAIPEGLPIVSTLALAFGMLRLAKQKVIVKKLSAVETLGGTNVICTDKTGTLTQNRIEVAEVFVQGICSRLQQNTSTASLNWIDNNKISGTLSLQHLLRISALCNTASYKRESGIDIESGDPLETALLKFVYCSGISKEELMRQCVKVEEIPFSSDTKIMGHLHRNSAGFYIVAKGAVEELMNRCSMMLLDDQEVMLDSSSRSQWLSLAEKKASEGLRMLAFAYRHTDKQEKEFLKELVLVALIGFIDPPREDVFNAIAECKSAGIKVVMITGDHPATARNIAEQLGISERSQEVMHGNKMKPWSDLSETDKDNWVNTAVFARVSPAQKLDLVSLYQEKKMVVGMTGDGVNDAPALKKADIGIAMGIRGTQVSQEAADMVLQDDSFSSIVVAIKQGRVIFDNIRKFVMFLLSCNLSELFVIAVAALMNLHFQLFPLQILFINLVTDVLPALALGVTDASPGIMQRKPYTAAMPIIDRKRWIAVFTYSSVIAMVAIGAVFTSHELLHDTEGWNAALCNNILFYTLIFSQVLHVLNMSFEKGVSFFRTEVFRNRLVWYAIAGCIGLAMISYWLPAVREVLSISIYGWKDWSIVIGFSFTSLLAIQILKRLKWII